MNRLSSASRKIGGFVGSRDNFPVNLKARLKELKVKQNELADRLKVTEAVVSQWINGRSIPEWDRLDEIAKILFLEPDALLRDPKKNKQEERRKIERETRLRIAKEIVKGLDEDIFKK
jgi:transcriptional regulator with XRE-family HTH domain